MLTWIGIDASRSLRRTGSAPGRSDSFGHTRTSWPWCPGLADTLASCSKVTAEWHKETPYSPRSSTWSCTPSYANGWRWWRQLRRLQRGLTCRCRTWWRIFIPKMGLSLEATREAAEGVRCSHRPLRPGQPQDKYSEDGEHVLPSIPRAWQDLGRGVWEADNRDRPNISGETTDEGELPGVRSWCCGGFAADTHLEPERIGLGVPGRVTPHLLPPITIWHE